MERKSKWSCFYSSNSLCVGWRKGCSPGERWWWRWPLFTFLAEEFFPKLISRNWSFINSGRWQETLVQRVPAAFSITDKSQEEINNGYFQSFWFRCWKTLGCDDTCKTLLIITSSCVLKHIFHILEGITNKLIFSVFSMEHHFCCCYTFVTLFIFRITNLTTDIQN